MTDVHPFAEPPPNNPEAEVALIGSILLEPEVMVRVAAIVRPDDFHVTANRKVYGTALRIHLDGRRVDPILLMSELGRAGLLDEIGGKERLIEFVESVATSANATEYAKLVRECAAKRMLDEAADDLKHAARNGVASASAADEYARRIADVRALFQDAASADLFGEIEMSETDQTPWLVRGYLARRSVTLLSALPKAGKSTMAYGIVAALQRGDPEWCGLAMPESCDALVLSEEDDSVLAETFRACQVDPKRVVVQTRRKAFPMRPLSQNVDAAIEACQRRPSIGLVVLDTWAFWANLPDKGGNDRDTVLRIYQDVARLAATGVAVLVIHHSRKGDGKHGQGVSGSNALTGAVDVVLELRHFGKGESGDVRAIEASGRFQRIPKEKVVEWHDGRYRDLGDADDARDKQREGRVGSFLLTCAGWRTAEEVADEAGIKAASALAALKAMYAKKEIQRVGRGAKGSPFLYASLNVPLHAQAQRPAEIA